MKPFGHVSHEEEPLKAYVPARQASHAVWSPLGASHTLKVLTVHVGHQVLTKAGTARGCCDVSELGNQRVVTRSRTGKALTALLQKELDCGG
jgi:hypothetical protein